MEEQVSGFLSNGRASPIEQNLAWAKAPANHPRFVGFPDFHVPPLSHSHFIQRELP